MTEPAWALGYDVAKLEAVASLFAKHHKPYVFGAFGLVKERDVANAAHEGRFYTDRGMGLNAAISAAAIIRPIRYTSTQHDFTGADVHIPAGGSYMSALAYTQGFVATKLLIDAPDPSWVEIFQEDHHTALLLKASGYRHMFTKVLAGSELKGVYLRGRIGFAGFNEHSATLHPADLATLECMSESGFKKYITPIEKELRSAGDNWAQHYATYNKRQSWTAFCLRGYDEKDPGFIAKPDEMSKKWKAENPERLTAECRDTFMMSYFPTVRKIMAEIPCAGFERIRFMRLASGKGELSRHAYITDRNAGTKKGQVARLHVPIITNDDVLFQAWDAFGNKIEKNLKAGSLDYLDVRKPHAVTNVGATERIHLVLDVYCNDRTTEWLAATQRRAGSFQ